MSDGHDGGGLRWLLTYADMITLLMAFFIMMYSMSVLNLEKFQSAAAGLREEFGPSTGGGQSGGSGILDHAKPITPPLEEGLVSVQQQLQEYIEDHALDDAIHITQQARGLVITLASDNLLFSVGEARLRESALYIVDQIAGLLREIPNPVVIEGHTCSLPIRTARYPSNWELSGARACAVVRYLVEEWNVGPERLAAIGYGASRPVASNRDEESRALNRRVEIVLLVTGEDGSAGAASLPGREEPGEGAPSHAQPPDGEPP